MDAYFASQPSIWVFRDPDATRSGRPQKYIDNHEEEYRRHSAGGADGTNGKRPEGHALTGTEMGTLGGLDKRGEGAAIAGTGVQGTEEVRASEGGSGSGR